ncbi:MAG TPA: hypothetical protein VMN60_10950 [Longimicrobiales bacterium]|nr:hypothetical protein [Longimicrobiales bacterium]
MLNPDFRDMLSAFIAEEVEFLVVGAYALSFHGLPRATGDLDFLIGRNERNAERVFRALASFGAPTHDLKIADLLTPDVVFQIGVEPNRIDILTSADGVGFDDAWEQRVIAQVDGLDVPIMSAGHVIQNKRAVGRPRDLADVLMLENELQRRGERPQDGSTGPNVREP